MSSNVAVAPKASSIPTSKMAVVNDMRRFLANVALAVAQGDMKADVGAVSIKACKEITASLYVEAKIASLQVEAGQLPVKFGELPIG